MRWGLMSNLYGVAWQDIFSIVSHHFEPCPRHCRGRFVVAPPFDVFAILRLVDIHCARLHSASS